MAFKGFTVVNLRREAEAILARAGDGPNQLVKVRAILTDAPVSDEAVIPAGWRVSAAGIRRVSGDGDAVLSPVLICERGRDPDRDSETVTVTFPRNGGWARRVVDRRDIADSHVLVRHAAAGMPVHSNNSKMLVQFLAEFEAVNSACLPQVVHSSRFGWQGEMDSFLWGTAQLTDTSADDAPAPVRYRAADQGDERWRVPPQLEDEGAGPLEGIGSF